MIARQTSVGIVAVEQVDVDVDAVGAIDFDLQLANFGNGEGIDKLGAGLVGIRAVVAVKTALTCRLGVALGDEGERFDTKGACMGSIGLAARPGAGVEVACIEQEVVDTVAFSGPGLFDELKPVGHAGNDLAAGRPVFHLCFPEGAVDRRHMDVVCGAFAFVIQGAPAEPAVAVAVPMAVAVGVVGDPVAPFSHLGGVVFAMPAVDVTVMAIGPERGSRFVAKKYITGVGIDGILTHVCFAVFAVEQNQGVVELVGSVAVPLKGARVGPADPHDAAVPFASIDCHAGGLLGHANVELVGFGLAQELATVGCFVAACLVVPACGAGKERHVVGVAWQGDTIEGQPGLGAPEIGGRWLGVGDCNDRAGVDCHGASRGRHLLGGRGALGCRSGGRALFVTELQRIIKTTIDRRWLRFGTGFGGRRFHGWQAGIVGVVVGKLDVACRDPG